MRRFTAPAPGAATIRTVERAPRQSRARRSRSPGLRRDYGERTALDGPRSRAAQRARRCWCSGPTAPGSRPCCACSRPCCARPRARSACSAARCPPSAWKLRGRIGYLGHDPLLYRDLSGRENLRFHARLHGLGAGAAEPRIEALLAAVGMERRAGDRVGSLSAGMLPAARDLPLRPARAGAAAARRARLQPRPRGAPAGAGADRPARRAAPGSWSPTTPSGRCRTPTAPSSSATAGTRSARAPRASSIPSAPARRP